MRNCFSQEKGNHFPFRLAKIVERNSTQFRKEKHSLFLKFHLFCLSIFLQESGNEPKW